MNRLLLLGSRKPRTAATFQGWLLSTWLPVMIMLIAIGIESTHAFSSDNTSGWMRAVYQGFAGDVTDATWAGVHHIIRKTGHFTGYGLMGLAWMRAWLIFWWQPLIRLPRRIWFAVSMAMAVLCTLLIAGLDELHQSYMPDRTGTVSDVLLDTTGAIVMLLLCLAISSMRQDD